MHLLLKEILILWYVFDTIDLQLISYFPKGRHCPTIFKASLKEKAPSIPVLSLEMYLILKEI